MIILLFGEVLVSRIAWLVAGKVGRGPTRGVTPSEWRREQRPQYVAPDDNPEFLRGFATSTEPAPSKNVKDEALLKDWEADLRRREEELRRREAGEESES